MAKPGDPEDAKRGLSDLASGYQKAAPFMGAGFSLAGTVGVFAWLGYKLDGWVGTEKPWFFIAGAVVGMIGGFVSFFRLVLGADKAGKKEPRA